MKSAGHKQIAIELHLKRTPVVTTGQRIRQGLLLNLSKEIGVINGHGNLICDSAQQKEFVLLPHAILICTHHQQGTHHPFVEDQRRECQRQFTSSKPVVDTEPTVAVATGGFLVRVGDG